MKGLNIDIKKIATKTAGNAGGLLLVGQINKIGFVAKQSAKVRAVGTLVLARVGLPFIAAKMGLSGKKGGDIIEGVEEGMATYAIAQMAAAFLPADKNPFPVISGYEDNTYVQGLGLVEEEENGMHGYENSVYLNSNRTAASPYL